MLSGGSWSATYGLNSSGEAAGYGDTGTGHFRAFTWSQATGITVLGTLGGLDSWGMAINDSGEVAGHATTASGYVHAFAWDGGALSDLGTLGGWSSYGYGINNSGSIVGYSTLFDGGSHAFVYLNGVMLDLNSLVPADSGWILNEAFSINDAGQILGRACLQGDCVDVRLDLVSAVPEPSAWMLLIGGLGLLAWRHRGQGGRLLRATDRK